MRNRPATALGSAVLGALLASAVAGKEPAPPPVSRCHDVAARDGVVYAAHSGALLARDVTDPAHPKLVGSVTLPGEALAVALEGPRAFVACAAHGVAVVGLADPWVPILLGRYNTLGTARDVAVQGTVVLIADGQRGLEIVDLANLEKPRSLASLPTRDRLLAVAWDGNLAATAEGAGGVRLLDLSSVGAPRVVATLDAALPALDVAICGPDRVVSAAERAGLAVWARDPSGIWSLASLRPTAGPARGVACRGTIVTVAAGDAGVELFDAANPRAPIRITGAKLRRGAPALRAVLHDDVIFVAADAAGLGVVRVSRPEEPEVLLPRARTMTIRMP